MLRLAWLLCVACLLHGPRAQAQASAAPPAVEAACPWLTAGSAAHALRGVVQVTVALKDPSHGVCSFTRAGNPRSELKIFVGGGEVPSCPADSAAVAGVGTHAYRCSPSAPRRASRQMLSGKVREKSFAIMVTNHARVPAGQLREIGEMVAGNLF